MSMNNVPTVPGLSRRSFINATALAAAGTAVAGRSLFAAAATPATTASRTAAVNYGRALVEKYGRPNSKFDGVSFGTITYSYRSMPGGSDALEVLKYAVIGGISALEMMGPVADNYVQGIAAGGGRGGLPGGSPAQNDAYTAMTAALAPYNTALQTARTNLATASLRVPTDKTAIEAAAKVVADADLALATARQEQLAKIQGSANRLNAEQLVVVHSANGVPAAAGRGGGRGGAGGAPAPMPAWMNADGLAKLADMKAMYDAAGVSIYALKNISAGSSDAELDYRMSMIKTVGGSHGTLELPTDEAVLTRLGAFGVKHGLMVGYHTHAQGSMTAFDRALAISPANALNVDTGHYYAANGSSAIPLLKKCAGRVASIHLKDRTAAGGNLMWGTGETDIAEIAKTMRAEKWTFSGSCELEYTIPPGSNAVIETARCRTYVANALMT